MSRGPSNGVCSRDLLISRASSESRISPLTAFTVTKATTSLQTSPPFIVVRLVRVLMYVRVHAAKFFQKKNEMSQNCTKGQRKELTRETPTMRSGPHEQPHPQTEVCNQSQLSTCARVGTVQKPLRRYTREVSATDATKPTSPVLARVLVSPQT